MTKHANRAAALLLPFLVAVPLAAQSYPGATQPALAGFGADVAVAGGDVLVAESRNTLRPGTVYVYRQSDGDWTEAAQLRAPEPEWGDGFGAAMAAAGDVLLVTQSDGDGSRVHVFTRQGDEWRRAGDLADSGLPSEAGFGAALAVAGPYVAVGAPGQDSVGAVHVYRRTRSGWEPAGVLKAEDAQAGDAFGGAIAVDGDRMLIGAPGRAQASGVAYLFRQDPGTGEWSQEAAFEGPANGRRALFGGAVALGADRAYIAAPGVDELSGAVFEMRFEPATAEWVAGAVLRPFDATRRTRFGSAVVAVGNGVYVGAPGAGSAGAIYALSREESGDWLMAEKVMPARIEEGASFGASLAVGRDVAVAGATGVDYGAGAAVVLSRRGPGWSTVATLESEPESLPAVTGGEVRCEAGVVADTYDCGEVDLLAFMPVTELGGKRGARTNDVWGWVDPQTGKEYAIVGRNDGTSFVDISNPSSPRYLGDLPMTEGSIPNVWRDIKVYENHAYVVADGAGQHGMQVFDLTRLRNVTTPVTFDADAHYDGIASAHNVVIDTESGFAFAVGARGGGETCGGGLHMIDIRDPKSPTFAGCFSDPQTGRASTGYSHDAQCVTYQGPDAEYRGREICLGANETALSIADVTDKDSPVAVSRASYPNVGYTHQGWLTEDHRYFYMNDELDEVQGKTSKTRTLIWDVSDLDDPVLVREFMGTQEASDHNLYVRGNLMYQSNYMSGLRILDISDPENPREVAWFDTVPYGDNGAGMGGSWSNYPYFPSGTIIVTSGREGLFIVKKRGPIS